MFSTASDIYLSFLDGIRKTYTTTVKPEVFCRIWNEWAMPEWIASNTSLKEGVDLTQKQIDDLAKLIHIYHVPVSTGSGTLFKKPYAGQSGVKDGLTGNSVSSVKDYLRALRVQFKLNYEGDREELRAPWEPEPNPIPSSLSSDQECGLNGTSDWISSTYMRSNMENVIMASPYRKPKDNRLYHKILEDYIVMVTDPNAGSPATWMRLEFICYPNQMTFSNNAFAFTLDLPFYQLTEIVSVAVKLYLERIQSPRWQSFFQEDMAKKVDKF